MPPRGLGKLRAGYPEEAVYVVYCVAAGEHLGPQPRGVLMGACLGDFPRVRLPGRELGMGECPPVIFSCPSSHYCHTRKVFLALESLPEGHSF